MSQTASRSRTVFRACVVNAVRGGEALMQQLVKVTQAALTEEESANRNIQQRNLVSDSLRLLNQHEAALVKGYPMALLEIFAEGPGIAKGRSSAEDTGMDFGELSLMDESEMQAQVELSKAQQSALHATDAVLAELNTLVSSAQGLRSVQPERNPLRPESYIRALQQVVGDTGVSPEVRQLWMQHMRDLLGKLLVDEYKKTAASLREHGVQPVGYAVLGTPSGNSGRGGGYGGPGMNTGMGTGYGGGYSGYGNSMAAPMGDYGTTGYGRGIGPSTGWSGDSMQSPMAPAAEEALLTVGILRQMLAGGDPFDPRAYGAAMPSQPVALQPAWVASPQVGGAVAGAQAMPHGGGYFPAGAAAEAIEDMAQLERLVGRLASGSQSASLSAPLSGWRGPGVAPVVYAAMPMEAATQSTAMAIEVVGRMMENIAQDSRLLPQVQQAVKSLEPALKQLVRHDGRFFSDGTHPARRLLDELTQRSLAFTAESTPGFSRFMRLLNGAVEHLTTNEIKDAGPFDTVLKALQSAWEAQEQKIKAHQEAQQKALLHAEQREMLAEKIAADIRKLPDLENVPADVLDFAAGPWADVIALAQVLKADDSRDEDPGGYLALVPVLLWSSQPDLTRKEPDRLNEAIPGLLAKLRKGLKTVNYPAVQTSAFLQRLVGLHQSAFEKPAPAPVAAAPQAEPEPEADAPPPAPQPAEAASSAPVPEDSAQAPVEAAPDPYADFVIGAWVELITNGRLVRTQLTWASPHGTLFLFTAPDASTQSMTRRMRDKLAAEGSLRVVPTLPATTRALDAVAAGAARKGSGGSGSTSGSRSSSSKTR
ncbi:MULTISPECIES: DUF1631 family protein [unclassified Acidovorax]|uniref:DUF1631 family protein n=1 Tax=unclassified Acidovorax TaxID=2684926 RepID=UPI001C44D333|nr:MULTISPECIES: DUF1631 family protein [unclassified Acidovorax]MBV7427213.1 DUF1631 domain-containing protein [Acidovorax sp. sif0732]MBV7448337.1 DUF1631 domain-containing protein [Acidovorax sp. sif0715]